MVNEIRTMKPKISIIMITYGHEKYIKEAIEGVFLQKTNFLVELIIANDKSPDNSDTIIRNLIIDCPENIKVNYILNDKNIGANPNYLNAYQQSQGEYIASCEGDDYWTDPLKLQKQVDFLENNKQYSLTFHKIKGISVDDKEPVIFDNLNEEKTYTIEDLAKGNFIHTPSVVFRKNLDKLPQWIQYSPIGDYPLHMINASFGLIKYFPETMAAYRVGSGIWSSKGKVYQIVNVLFSLKLLMDHFKNDVPVLNHLKSQNDEYYTALTKPIEDKDKLALQIKDYKYIEKITDFPNIIKILKIKIKKKLGF